MALSWPQRLAARLARAAGLRVYEAAQDARDRGGSRPGGSSANAEVSAAGAKIAWTARDAVRNDAFARRIVDLWVANAVGSGVTYDWEGDARKAVWKRWAETAACDAEGRKTLAAIEAMALRAVVTDGEVIVRLLPGPVTVENPVGLSLQVIEADHLDRAKTGTVNGATVIQGVEINEAGRPVAYWLLPRHPGEVWPLLPRVGSATSLRVPAEYVLHIFRQDRPGQVRGVSWLAPVLGTLRDLTDYESALLMKAKIEACMSAIVTDSGEDQLTGPAAGRVTDAAGNVIETFEPGMVLYRRGMGEIEIVNPSGGGSHLQFARRALERAAVGAGLTYDQVSGDLTGANYSSLRAGKIEFRALNSQTQWTLLLPQLCAPVAAAFDRYGAAAGLWPMGGGECRHTPEAPEVVDPLKDVTAIITQVRAGLLAPQDAAAMLGWDYGEIVEKIAEADALRDAAGVVVDSDPRRVAQSGAAQDAKQLAAIEIAATGAAMPAADSIAPADSPAAA